MLNEVKIRKALREWYNLNTGSLRLNYKELECCFKLYHKILSGQKNTNRIGSSALVAKYCKTRDNARLKSLADCIEIY